MIRISATDWDRDIVEAINRFLQKLSLDENGMRPYAYMDEPMLDSVGIHIAPLDGYSKAVRHLIATECLRIRRNLAQNLTFAQEQPYEVTTEECE